MFTVEIRVGRLYELRMQSVESEEEIASLGQKGRALMESVGSKAVVVADFRAVRFVRAELVDHLLKVTARSNAQLERSALLIRDDNAIFNSQLRRMVREANNPGRRIFTDVHALRDWLGEVLTPAEQKRLALFLSEGPPSAPHPA